MLSQFWQPCRTPSSHRKRGAGLPACAEPRPVLRQIRQSKLDKHEWRQLRARPLAAGEAMPCFGTRRGTRHIWHQERQCHVLNFAAGAFVDMSEHVSHIVAGQRGAPHPVAALPQACCTA
eukprot:1160532-Pelagomonas_calceolata.AAC.14